MTTTLVLIIDKTNFVLKYVIYRIMIIDGTFLNLKESDRDATNFIPSRITQLLYKEIKEQLHLHS